MPSRDQTSKSRQKSKVAEWEARDKAMWDDIRGLNLNDQTYLINAEGNKVMVQTGGPEDIELRKMGYTGEGSIGKSYGGQIHFPGRSYASEGANTYEDIEGNIKPVPKNIDTVVVTPSFSGGQTAAPVTDKQVVQPAQPAQFQAQESFIPKGVTVAPVTTKRDTPTKSTYGFHKQDGQNFLTVNNDDPYWNDRVMGTGDGFSHAELKNKPKQEVDTQAIKNWLSSMFG